ncbi:MAG: hypothetical protein Q8O88_00705 [bacterium]|nr:hypothetical protein [bacterium]
MAKKVTDNELLECLKDSNYVSIRQIGQKFYGTKGLSGEFYNRIYSLVKTNNINTSHLQGQAWNRGRKHGFTYPINVYLENKRFIKSNELKHRLIKEGLKERQCEDCLNTLSKNRPIPLQLHHIDGNKKNNNLINLQLLCPTCHTFTDNYCGKNIKIKKIKRIISDAEIISAVQTSYSRRQALLKLGLKDAAPNYDKINIIITKYGIELLTAPIIIEEEKITDPHWRKRPRPQTRKVERPNKEDLEKMVWEMSSEDIAKKFGLSSGSTIAKWCEEYGISKPGLGYWTKQYIVSGRLNISNLSKPKPLVHGTVHCYKKGCRCESCIDNYRIYNAERKHKERQNKQIRLILLIVFIANLNCINLIKFL